MSRRKQLKPRSLKRDAVDGEDLVAMVTDDVRDNQLEDSISKDNNEISSAVASISGLGGGGDDDDDMDEVASDRSHSPRHNDPSPTAAEENGQRDAVAEAAEEEKEEAAAAAAEGDTSVAAAAFGPVDAKRSKKRKKTTLTLTRRRKASPAKETAALGEAEEAEEEYRCDVCHAIFASWHRFMDHRNYDCTSVSGLVWMNQESPTRRMSSSPSPDREVSPLTPSSAEVPHDPLPYAIGLDENHPYACRSCEKSYSKQSYLKKHEQLTHSDQLHYSCKHCDRLFRHKRSRDRHVKLHAGDRHYRCPQCQTVFARSDHLKVHMKTHDSLRSFSCPECNLNFTNIAVLTAHMLSHVDPDDGQRDETTAVCYNCPLCSATLSSAKQFESHMESHSSALIGSQTKLEDDEDKDIDVDDSGDIKREKSDDCEYDSYAVATEEKIGLDKPRKLPIRRIYTRDESPWSNKDPDKSAWKKNHESMGHVDGGMGLDCPYCNQRNFNTLTLSAHIGTFHANISGNFYSCPICFMVFASALKLEQHMSCAHQHSFPDRMRGSLQCEFCMMEFLDSTSHRLHLDSIHPEKRLDSSSKGATVATIYCSQCTMGFPHIYALADHMHQSHGYNKFASSNGSSVPYSAVSPFHLHATSPEQLVAHSYRDLHKLMVETIVGGSLQDGYRCHQCDLSLTDYHSFQLHVENHQAAARVSSESSSSLKCTECEMSFSAEEQLESHIFSHFLSLTTEYGCTSCLKLFSKPDELQKHLMDIHAHHLYRCSLCKHVFDSKVNIQVHFAVKHSNECKVYKCTRCTSVFRSEMECQLHVKVHHLGVSKPYRCFFCKDSFAVESDLQTHVATHKKQFVCPICHEAFLVEYLLDKHLETKHSSPDVPLGNGSGRQDISVVASLLVPSHSLPPDGILLGMQTTSPSSIASEKRTPVSPSSFVGGVPSPSLKKGDLIYKCEVCDVKFSDEGTLQKHHTHDHCLSAEMQQLMKSRSTSQQQSANHEKSGSLGSGPGTSTGDKFSQLCMYCKQMFKTKGELEKHMKTHVLPSNQKCNICDEVFPSAMILAEHKLTHCKVVKGNVCVVCKVSMKNEEEFFSHSQQHSFQGSNLQCVICRQTLASMLELQLHGRHHFQTTPVEVYSCCICLKSFDSKENLISRLGMSSGTEHGVNNGISCYICKPCYHHEGAAPAELKCSTCEMKFDNHVLLAVHSLEHRRTYQCIKCQESFGTEYEIQLHVATHVLHEGNVHECRICTNAFDSPAKLQLHLIEHSFQGKLEMSCYICDRSFAQASAIQVHMLDHGMANRKYVCSLCPQRFFFSAELQNHRLTLNHNSSPIPKTNGTELACPECSKVFTNYANLSAHRRSHEKHPPATVLECTACPVQCSSIRALQEHFLSSHSEPGSSKVPLQCPECNRQFPSLSSLQGHMRVHNSGTKYSCTECGKAFSLPQNLAIHINSHKDDLRPFECDICHKKFAKKENMKSHMRSHCINKDQCGDRSASGSDHAVDTTKIGNKQSSAQTENVGSGIKLNRPHGDASSSKPEEHLCPICGGRFQQMVDLALHVNKIHHIKAEVVEAEIVQGADAPSYLPSRSGKQSIPSNESVLCSSGIPSEREPRAVTVLASK